MFIVCGHRTHLFACKCVFLDYGRRFFSLVLYIVFAFVFLFYQNIWIFNLSKITLWIMYICCGEQAAWKICTLQSQRWEKIYASPDQQLEIYFVSSFAICYCLYFILRQLLAKTEKRLTADTFWSKRNIHVIVDWIKITTNKMQMKIELTHGVNSLARAFFLKEIFVFPSTVNWMEYQDLRARWHEHRQKIIIIMLPNVGENQLTW